MERWVVVGAGSAGCVLANRLSADPNRDVVLVDDGPDLLPGRVPAGIDGPNFLDSWSEPGRTHPDLLATRTSGGAPLPYRRGRGVGGSSAVNAMIALRGDDEQYRRWGWDDVDAAWARMQIPTERATDAELGPLDRALLTAAPSAERVELTRRSGRRVTSAEAYLWPVLDRPNLSVSADSEVDRLRLLGRRVTGLHLADGSQLDADHVVLAAGAIHTPVILLRSGVQVGGVGQGLQDHPAAALTLRLRPADTAAAGSLVVGSVLQQRIGRHLIQVMPLNHLGRESSDERLAVLMIALMTPVGADGAVTIDTDGRPVVDFALLRHEEDLGALASGVRLATELLARPAFSDIVEEVYVDDVGTPVDALGDDDNLRSWLRSRGAEYVHASSSCAMGRVVDPDFAVIGYAGLSVCDASIFPNIPDVNTHLPVVLAAERFGLRGTMRP